MMTVVTFPHDKTTRGITIASGTRTIPAVAPTGPPARYPTPAAVPYTAPTVAAFRASPFRFLEETVE
jgi:hypothetical protein